MLKITDNYNGDFNTLKNNLNVLIGTLQMGTEKAKEVSQGDLMVTLQKRSENEGHMEALDNMVKSNATIINEFITNIENIVLAGQQLQSVATQISQGSTEQASNTEEVSASIIEGNKAVAITVEVMKKNVKQLHHIDY